jgi:Arc/MetJ family transcription regulator
MTKHQIQIDDDVWAWAQRQTGQVKPASFLRNILTRAMYGTSHVQPTVSDLQDKYRSEAQQYVSEAQHNSMRDRWRAIQLWRDPGDPVYMEYRKKFIDAFDSELEALESAERLYHNGYDQGEDGESCVSNMRGYLVYLVKRMEAAS